MIDGPIAVIAPCGAYVIERFEAGLAIARDHGLTLEPLPGLHQPHRYLAAPDDVRRAHLIQAFTDPRYAAIWVARGGYGLTRLLDGLPWDTFQDKPVIGFSDVTALFAAMYARGFRQAVHAPVLHSLQATDEASRAQVFARLRGQRIPMSGTPLTPGTAEGPLIGGNLCLLAALAGTPDAIVADGHILVVEEVGEYAYRMDRMLQQLVSSGALDGVRGIALGEFVSCQVPDGADYTVLDVLLDHLAPLGVPIVGDLPIGHGARNHAFVWGEHVRLDHGLHPL